MHDHDAQVVPFADVTDRWVLRCRCGLLAEYATRGEAELARDDHMEEQGAGHAVPVEAALWIVQALMDPAARGDEVTDRSAAAIFRMVRYYDATGIGWGGERSQANQVEAT